MTKALDLTGERFNKLIVLSRAESSAGGKSRWNCLCDCGKKSVVQGVNLKASAVKSCGCLRLDADYGRTHGGYYTPEYSSWSSLRGRCNNKENPKYPRYGGRGITVCDRWNSFENFFLDMGVKPTPEHSIERLNNDGNYDPDNCIWATREVQSNNQSTTRYYDYKGTKVKVVELAKIACIAHSAMYQRLVYHKGNVEAALNPKNTWSVK